MLLLKKSAKLCYWLSKNIKEITLYVYNEQRLQNLDQF